MSDGQVRKRLAPTFAVLATSMLATSMLATSMLATPMLATPTLAACGGASDVVKSAAAADAAQSAGADTKLALVAFAVPKVGFDKLVPAFNCPGRAWPSPA